MRLALCVLKGTPGGDPGHWPVPESAERPCPDRERALQQFTEIPADRIAEAKRVAELSKVVANH